MAGNESMTALAPILHLPPVNKEQMNPLLLVRYLNLLKEIYDEVPLDKLCEDDLVEEEKANREEDTDKIMEWIQNCSKDSSQAALMVYSYDRIIIDYLRDLKRILKTAYERKLEKQRRQAIKKRWMQALHEVNPPANDADRYLTDDEQELFIGSVSGAIASYLGGGKGCPLNDWRLDRRAHDYTRWTLTIKKRKEKEANQKQAEIEYDQYINKLSTAIEKLKAELGKSKKPKFGYPPELKKMSRQALVYADESYAHKTIIFFERPGMEAADYNIRTLQSEGRVIFWVPEKDPVTNKWVTRKVEKEGPTNFIFTTTVPELHPENETRHWSLSMDESPKLTSAAKLETAKRYGGKVDSFVDNLLVLQHLQNELRSLNVCIPYAGWLSEHTPNRPIRMRRDFSKLLALVEIIAILHQHQRYVRKDGILVASLSDYFMARELVDKVFQASLFGINEKVKGLVNGVRSLYEKKLDRGEQEPSVKPLELAPDLGCSSSSVSRWLRPAIEAGLVEIVSETAKGRIKSVKPGLAGKDVASVLPSIEDLGEAFPELASGFKAVHPVTGKELTLKDTSVVVTAENNISTGL